MGLGNLNFAVRSALAIGLLVVCTVGFPFVFPLIARLTDCQSVGGACGALALVAGITLKPAIYVVFVIALSLTVAARLLWLDLPRVWALPFALVLLTDTAFSVIVGAHWSVAFSMGVLSLPVPWGLMAGILTVVFLAIVDEDDARLYERWALIAVVLAAVCLTLKLIDFLAIYTIKPGQRLSPAISLVMQVGMHTRPVAFVSLVGVYGGILLGRLGGSGGLGEPHETPAAIALPERGADLPSSSTFGRRGL